MALLRAAALRCTRCGEPLGPDVVEACSACQLPVAQTLDPARLLFADMQCLRVIHRSVLAGIVCDAAIAAGHAIQWLDPYSPVGIVVLGLSYVFFGLIPIYLSLGLALFGPWASMRPIGVLVLVAVLVAALRVPFMVDFTALLALNAGVTSVLCVSMAIVARNLAAPGVVAGFVIAGVFAVYQFMTAVLEFGLPRYWHEGSVSRYVLDECFVRLLLVALFAIALRPLTALVRARREIERVLAQPQGRYT
ncbi:MAG: hypothetical protein IT450_13675 [Phycisphaerales bacterium]|nr:hypothetical protein [Phycisphaerales bacterium]